MSVLVCGVGSSGLAACRLLAAERIPATALDMADKENPEAAAALAVLGIPFHAAAKNLPEGRFDLAIMSPGIPLDGWLAQALAERQIPMVAEAEFGWSRFRGKTIAVTGSNGKSSLVKALADVLQAAGKTAIACGNYGLPVCDAVLDFPGADWLVIEVSSFQLETMRKFRPDIGILLNLLANHLDRHGTLDAYRDLKFRLFAAQRETDVALLPAGELADVFRRTITGHGRLQTFSGADVPRDIGGSYFDPPPLRPAAAAVFAAAEAAGVDAATVADALRRFVPLLHRSQCVGTEGNIRYVDDSKATNLAALCAAVEMQQGNPVYLLAGGRLKETDLSGPPARLGGRVERAYLYGEAAAGMADAWGGIWRCRRFTTLAEAAEAARRDALADGKPGAVVLLAPGCTSYDQFASYTARGDYFQDWVKEKIEL